MGEVIHLSEFIAAQPITKVRPKSESRAFNNQRYLLRFDPNAPPDSRWHWTVKFTRVFEYSGSAADIDKADKAARKMITDLTTRMEKAG